MVASRNDGRTAYDESIYFFEVGSSHMDDLQHIRDLYGADVAMDLLKLFDTLLVCGKDALTDFELDEVDQRAKTLWPMFYSEVMGMHVVEPAARLLSGYSGREYEFVSWPWWSVYTDTDEDEPDTEPETVISENGAET